MILAKLAHYYTLVAASNAMNPFYCKYKPIIHISMNIRANFSICRKTYGKTFLINVVLDPTNTSICEQRKKVSYHR